MKIQALAIAALLTALPGGTISAQTAEEPKAEKKICRTEKVTGSRTRSQRICMTQAQWRELETRTLHGMNEFNRSAAGSGVRRDAEATYGPGGMNPYSGTPNQ